MDNERFYERLSFKISEETQLIVDITSNSETLLAILILKYMGSGEDFKQFVLTPENEWLPYSGMDLIPAKIILSKSELVS